MTQHCCGELPTPLVGGQTSRVYPSISVQYLYISCYVTANKLVLLYLLLRLLPQWWPRPGCPFVLFTVPLYTHTHMSSSTSASRSLCRLRKWHFSFQFYCVLFIGYTLASAFCFRFCLEIYKPFLLRSCSVSRWRPQKVDKRMVLEYTHGLFIT
jgi:hypothetical protein